MKKFILILFICFFILNFVSASCSISKSRWIDKFENNPDRAWDKLEKNLECLPVASNVAYSADPSRTMDLINQQIAKQYTSLSSITLNPKDGLWIENSGITNLVEQAVKENVSILNKNIFLKREWFSQKGIIDEGSEIESYDGVILKTKGNYSTSFNITDKLFYGAKILSSGKVILVDKTVIGSSTVSKSSEGGLIFQGGVVDVSPFMSNKFSLKNGELKIGKRIFSGENVKVFGEGNMIRLEGTDITETIEGKDISRFSGNLKTNGKIKILGKSSSYTVLSPEGGNSRTYKISKETYIVHDKGILTKEENPCENSLISCIQIKENKDTITAVGDNDIRLKNLDKSLKSLKVNKIDDDSSVVFNNEEDVSLKFTKNPLIVKGDLSKLDVGISTVFLNLDGEPQKLNIVDNHLTFGDSSKLIGTSTNMVDEVIKNIDAVSKEQKDNLHKKLEKKWGVKAYDYTFTCNDKREVRFINSIFEASKTASINDYGVKVTPQEVATTFLAEGGVNLFLDDGLYYEHPEDMVLGGSDLGVDVIGSPGEFERLQRKGFIPSDIKIHRRDMVFDGHPVTTGQFKGIENSLKVQAGVLADRKKDFIRDYKQIYGTDPRDVLSKEDIFYWTTIYYNSVKPKDKLISQNAIPKKGNKNYGTYCRDPYTNAARRMTTYECFNGMFDYNPISDLLVSNGR